MKNSYAGVDLVPMEEAISRAGEYGRTLTCLTPASCFADAIWPGHKMKAQGAGAAASQSPRGDAQAGEGRMEE